MPFVTCVQKPVDAAGEVVNRSSQTTGGLVLGLSAATALLIILQQRYPRWWFDFARELTRFEARVGAYAALLTDTYPSIVDEQAMHLEIDYPDAKEGLNRCHLRVAAYAFLLVADKYPPLSLSA